MFGERAKGVVDTPLPEEPRVNQDVLDSFEAIRSSFGNIDADNMLDAYASANLQSMQDAGNLYTGIGTLRYRRREAPDLSERDGSDAAAGRRRSECRARGE